MLEFIGWIGSIAFAICGAPQAWQSLKEGHSKGIAMGFISLWLIGEICTIVYVIPKGHAPLIFNYLGNLLFAGTIIYYKLYPRLDGQSHYIVRLYKMFQQRRKK